MAYYVTSGVVSNGLTLQFYEFMCIMGCYDIFHTTLLLIKQTGGKLFRVKGL